MPAICLLPTKREIVLQFRSVLSCEVIATKKNFVGNVLLYSYLYDKKISQEIFNKIDKICYDSFGEHAKTSVYGTKNEFEFFAETFCELVTKHNPSNTAKALDIYLKGDKLL